MDGFNDALPIIIAVLVGLVIIIYGVLLSKKLNSTTKDVADSELEERRRSIKVSRVAGFIPYKFRAFYDVLKAAMPSNYVILPNIAIELLFQRANRKELQLEGQYTSFCIFTDSFSPVLVIQLNDYSVESDAVFIITDKVKDLIRSLGISILEYDIRDEYSIDEIRRSVAKAMNPLYYDK